MAETLSRNSPLAGFGAGTDGREPRIAERLGLSQINLRGDGVDLGFRQAVEKALGLTLPDAGRSSSVGPVTVLWLGPDEWLVVGEDGGDALMDLLHQALEGLDAAVTDVSDARAVMRLSGSGARDVLAKGCTLDLHRRIFGPGQVAQSTLAKADVILFEVAGDDDGEPTYDIHVGRSFAEYLWLWLAVARSNFHACRED
jgi:sarcosine oxidase subunit gamma